MKDKEDKNYEELMKALEREKEAKRKTGFWADMVGIAGLILGTIVYMNFSEILGGIINIGTIVIWILMKNDS